MAVELLETLKETITAYTGLSPTTFFTAVALGLAVYYAFSGMFGGSSDYHPQQRSSSFEDMQPLPPPVQLGEVTDDELKAYDGKDPSKPLLMAIKGQIYDVTQSRMFYGPGGPYALFAGKDASRALAKMSFEEKDLNGDLTGLGVFELEALRDWEYKFMSKYAKVGTIKNPETAPEASTADQPAQSTAAQPAEQPAESTAGQPAEPSAAQPAEQPAEPSAAQPAELAVATGHPKVTEDAQSATVTKEESSTTSTVHPKVTEDAQSENAATVTKVESLTTSEANKED